LSVERALSADMAGRFSITVSAQDAEAKPGLPPAIHVDATMACDRVHGRDEPVRDGHVRAFGLGPCLSALGSFAAAAGLLLAFAMLTTSTGAEDPSALYREALRQDLRGG